MFHNQDPFRDILAPISQHPTAISNGEDDAANPPITLDALIVGAGFSGVHHLHILRAAGFNVKLVEAGQGYGGVWYWNRYPGARVDINEPYYQFADPAIWKDWEWKSRFPGSTEIREYFEHVADVWDLRRDTEFGAWVSNAMWDDVEKVWVVRTKRSNKDGNSMEEKGEVVYKAKWFLPCTGFAAKRHFPDWKETAPFKGTLLHPSFWPNEGLDLERKRIAVIGTGATAVQIIQSMTSLASQLTVFQRTPNTALPMKQEIYSPPHTTNYPKPQLQALLDKRTSSFAGLDYNFYPKKTFADTPEERERLYDTLWDDGSLKLWLGSHFDMLADSAANDYAYNYWLKRTRPRIKDPRVRDLLAPVKKPYAFGTKRIPLEINYFECFNEPHVALVDINTTPVVRVNESGIVIATEDEGERELPFDVIISATGYDAVTGGLVQMNVTGEHGRTLGQYWKDGVETTLGVTVPGFPNMFMTYGPQAPTALWTGPACAEATGDWIKRIMLWANDNDVDKVVATVESGGEWRRIADAIASQTLLPQTDSWYTGANIPGKVKQPLFFLGGAPEYIRRLDEALANGLKEFELWRGDQKVTMNSSGNANGL